MKGGFPYGLLFTVCAIALLWLSGEIAFWYSRRVERRHGVNDTDVAKRLARAESAIREAEEEIASVRAELAAHR